MYNVRVPLGSLYQDSRPGMMQSAWFWGHFESEPVGLAGGSGVRYERRVKDDPEVGQLERLELPVISQFMVKTAGDAGCCGR